MMTETTHATRDYKESANIVFDMFYFLLCVLVVLWVDWLVGWFHDYALLLFTLFHHMGFDGNTISIHTCQSVMCLLLCDQHTVCMPFAINICNRPVISHHSHFPHGMCSAVGHCVALACCLPPMLCTYDVALLSTVGTLQYCCHSMKACIMECWRAT